MPLRCYAVSDHTQLLHCIFMGTTGPEYAFVTADGPISAERSAAAFRNAAVLCGAKNDPF
jgi:hypothetical protein